MSKIYNDDGFVNWPYIYDQTRAFCMMVGPRGTGKTFGLMKLLLDRGVKFLYVRRLKTQLDQCATIDANPFRAVNRVRGVEVAPFRATNVVRFCPAEPDENDKVKPTGPAVCIGVALSTFATIRGADFSDIDAIIFDEAVPMAGEKPVKDEFSAFLNFYETVNRNRELKNRPPVKCFLLGNANKLSNPYFAGWHFMQTALKMIKGNQMMWRSPDGTRMMILLLNSPISAQKAETVLYKNGSNDFLQMALDNSFRTDATNIHSFPLSECVHVVSVGEIGIYTHKGTGLHYVSKTVNKGLYYNAYGMHLKQFLSDFAGLKLWYLANRIYFESYEIELIFRELYSFI